MAVHLVTGGSGYLGSFLARELLKRGNRVRVVDLLRDSTVPTQAEFYQTDITNRDGIRKAMQGVDYVHHAAAQVPIKKAGLKFWEVNVRGTAIVHEEAHKAKVKHFSYISSSAVFGNVTDADCPIGLNPENLRPIEDYGRSKLAAEKILTAGTSGMSFSIIRPRTIVGPERLGIFQILFDWVSQGRDIYIIGNGKNLFQFVHVDDIVNVSIETAERSLSGYFNIGTDRYETIEESLQAFCDLAKTGSKVRRIPFPLAASALYFADKLGLSPLAPWHYLTYHKPYYFDMKPAFDRLHWRPQYSNIEMLIQSYQWYLDNRNHLGTNATASPHRGLLNQKILKILKGVS